MKRSNIYRLPSRYHAPVGVWRRSFGKNCTAPKFEICVHKAEMQKDNMLPKGASHKEES